MNGMLRTSLTARPGLTQEVLETVYRKLDASSRHEAVALAAEGLL